MILTISMKPLKAYKASLSVYVTIGPCARIPMQMMTWHNSDVVKMMTWHMEEFGFAHILQMIKCYYIMLQT